MFGTQKRVKLRSLSRTLKPGRAGARLGSDDEEMDERLNAQMTGELHFGGGFVRKAVPTEAPADAGVDDPLEHRRTKKEVRGRSKKRQGLRV